MAQFKYVAVTAEGTKLRATTEAMSADALRNELLGRQLEVKKISEKKTFGKIEITKQKVKRAEIMHFSRQIGAFVRAGIPIVDAIETVREGTDERPVPRRSSRTSRSRSRPASRSPRRSPVTATCSRPTTSASCAPRSSPVSSTSCSTSSRCTSSVTSSRARR